MRISEFLHASSIVCSAALLVVLCPVTRAYAGLRFMEPMANAGIVRTGTHLEHPFQFVNEGPEEVEIIRAQASCGCMTPHLDQRVYRQGQRGEVRLEVNTLGQAAGLHTWTLRLAYRCGNAENEVTLQLGARVVAEVTVQPSTMVVFANRAAGHEIVLIDRRPRPLTITGVQTSSDQLSTRVSQPARDPLGHWICKIALDIAKDYPQGRHDEEIVIGSDDPDYRQLKVKLTIIQASQQRLTATPHEVSLVGSAGQPLPSRIVLVRDKDNGRVKIERVLADDPAIVCQWAQGPDNLATLKVRVDRNRLHGDGLQSAVHVEVSEPVREILSIPVTCFSK